MNITKEAQDKLAELRDSHKWCCIEIKSDYNYVWDVYLTRASFGRDEGDHIVSVSSGSYEDLNQAISAVYKRAKAYLAKEGTR